jgi:hypothetical protein
MGNYIRLLTLGLLLLNCDVSNVVFDEVDLVLDGRTFQDTNGYYHIQLDSTTNQTIHRIDGQLFNQQYMTKIDWNSNLSWEFNGELVPTVNSTSYTNKFGEVSVVIAPIYSMKGDTLIVNAIVTESNETETIKFVLK